MKGKKKSRVDRLPPDELWVAFAGRHKGNSFLERDPLYALTEPIIDAIQAAVPAFFTADQEAFERDLAQTADFGFFHKRALGLTSADRNSDDKSGSAFENRHQHLTQTIDEMLGKELQTDGLRAWEITEYHEQYAKQQKGIESRMAAYTGWLITNPQFHAEVRELRKMGEAEVRRLGRFPAYPTWPVAGPCRSAGELDDYLQRFYLRWGLERLLTWDWPIPMAPDFGAGQLFDCHLPSEAGVILFIPWYLLRGEKLNLQLAAQHIRTACGATHLWNWLGKTSGKGDDDLGDLRFQHLHWLYRYHELVLMRRYGAACRGNLHRLDVALAKVMGREEDTVKKLRLQLKKTFQAAEPTVT